MHSLKCMGRGSPSIKRLYTYNIDQDQAGVVLSGRSNRAGIEGKSYVGAHVGSGDSGILYAGSDDYSTSVFGGDVGYI